jgi:hypothetical protein
MVKIKQIMRKNIAPQQGKMGESLLFQSIRDK